MPQFSNIVLVGFMGTGKTSVGHCLADRLGMSFLDMDDVIEERQGKPISRIFAEDGEARFRELERALVRELAARTGLVVATGGGIVLNAANVQDFSRTGLVVCLAATPQAILERVSRETHRPLLTEGNKMAKIRGILETRQALYDAVPNQVDTTPLDVAQVADRVASMFDGA